VYKFQRLIFTQYSVSVRNIERLSVSLNEGMGQACQQLDTLTRDFSSAKLGMFQHNQGLHFNCNDSINKSKDKHQKAVLQWLSPLKPGQAHLQVQSSHQPGTSKWLQGSKSFQAWLEGVNEVLWISGPRE
jgi:uncharacterized protein (DUF2164 family)